MATVWVLGDQLHRHRGSLANAPDRVHMIEARDFPIRKPYFPETLALVFSAMRHAQEELADSGRRIGKLRPGTGPQRSDLERSSRGYWGGESGTTNIF